jgi:16S rRNA (adenine1518-N6/adenine1519-N6)-dimethyltransferase
MSLEETKGLLRTHRITPNKLLGQNFMVEPSFYDKMCRYAALKASDVVLDAGAGFGFLTRYLSSKCRGVVAVEKDQQVAAVLHEQVSGLNNVKVIEGDVLNAQLPTFNKVISIPPYYLSSNLTMWLLERKLDCAVLIVQKEFANRLVAAVRSEDYGWLTILTFQHAQVQLHDAVHKEVFYPQPEVDSLIISLKPWSQPPFQVKDEEFFKQMVKWLFTQRNKKLSKALKPFLRSTLKLNKEMVKEAVAPLPNLEHRPRELSPQDFGELADAITR